MGSNKSKMYAYNELLKEMEKVLFDHSWKWAKAEVKRKNLQLENRDDKVKLPGKEDLVVDRHLPVLDFKVTEDPAEGSEQMIVLEKQNWDYRYVGSFSFGSPAVVHKYFTLQEVLQLLQQHFRHKVPEMHFEYLEKKSAHAEMMRIRFPNTMISEFPDQGCESLNELGRTKK